MLFTYWKCYGVGSSHGESVVHYVQRYAQSHQVSIISLIKREPETEEYFLIKAISDFLFPPSLLDIFPPSSRASRTTRRRAVYITSWPF